MTHPIQLAAQMAAQPDGITVTCTNNRTGESWTRVLAPDDYAVIHGPELELTERRVLLRGGVTATLLPKRGAS